MKIKDLISAIGTIETDRNISNDVVISALAEGLEKAYRKHINCPDAVVRVDVNEEGEIRVFQQRTVVEEVEDDEIEVALEEVLEEKPDAKLGDIIEEEVSIAEFGRSNVTLVKNVMLQKIKAATKQVIYDEYVDKIDDLVVGTVENVEEKFVLVNIGKTIAIMPKAEQIPYEKYYDGQRLRLVIKDVNKESKGPLVVVSRSSAMLVKRLFELSVPEIFDGTVEVKAIAREANERTKMAVVSNNPNVDATGACIGPKGARVISVLEEITEKGNTMSHENIDIVDYSTDYVEYVKNVLKPANVVAVVPNDENNTVLVVVNDQDLSLAIGRKGINARLAVKLLERKVDIKTVSAVEEMGIDYKTLMLAYQAKEAAKRRTRELEAMRAAEEAAQAAVEEALANQVVVNEEPEVVEEEVTPVVVEEVVTKVVENTIVEEVAPVVEEVETVEEVKSEPVVEEVKPKKAKLTVKASDYVSKYEDLADAKKTEKKTSTNKKKKQLTKEELEAQEINKKLESLKNKEYEIKPEYSEEELEEFNNADDDHWYDDDVDYDEYDEYYDN